MPFPSICETRRRVRRNRYSGSLFLRLIVELRFVSNNLKFPTHTLLWNPCHHKSYINHVPYMLEVVKDICSSTISAWYSIFYEWNMGCIWTFNLSSEKMITSPYNGGYIYLFFKILVSQLHKSLLMWKSIWIQRFSNVIIYYVTNKKLCTLSISLFILIFSSFRTATKLLALLSWWN